jgi:hypothetical protein
MLADLAWASLDKVVSNRSNSVWIKHFKHLIWKSDPSCTKNVDTTSFEFSDIMNMCQSSCDQNNI